MYVYANRKPFKRGFSSGSIGSLAATVLSFSSVELGCGFLLRNCLGKENIAIDANIIKLPMATGPNHQAPIQRGSLASKPGFEKFTYHRVHTDPTINPEAGPRIRTPIVIAIYMADCLLATLSSM